MPGGKRSLSIELRLKDFASKNMDKVRGKAALLTSKMVKGFKNAAKSVFSLKGAIGGLVGALAIRNLARFGKQLIDNQDQLIKMARSVGSTVEELSALEFSFKRTGIEAGKLEIIMTGFERARAQALNAADLGRTNEQIKAFRTLGITITDLRKKGAVELVRELARGIENIGLEAGRTALQRIFPDNFRKLIELLGNGVAKFDELTEAAKKSGAVMSTTAAQSAEKFNDSLTDLGSTIGDVGRKIIDPLLPGLASFFSTMSKGLGDLSSSTQEATDNLTKFERALKTFDENQQLIDSIRGTSGTIFGFDFGPGKKTLPGAGGPLPPLKGAAGVPSPFFPDPGAIDELNRKNKSDRHPLGIQADRLRAEREALEALMAGPQGPPIPDFLTKDHSDIFPTSGAVEKVKTFWGEFSRGAEDGAKALGTMQDAGASMVFILADGLTNVVTSFLDGTKSMSEAFSDFIDVAIQQVIRLIAQLAIAAALQTAFGVPTLGLATPGGAKGGIFPSYARGGVVPARPQLIEVGEGGQREAVVPLPDGRSIPVTMEGGGVPISITFNFDGRTDEAVEDVQRNRRELETQIAAIISRSSSVRRTIQEVGR